MVAVEYWVVEMIDLEPAGFGDVARKDEHRGNRLVGVHFGGDGWLEGSGLDLMVRSENKAPFSKRWHVGVVGEGLESASWALGVHTG